MFKKTKSQTDTISINEKSNEIASAAMKTTLSGDVKPKKKNASALSLSKKIDDLILTLPQQINKTQLSRISEEKIKAKKPVVKNKKKVQPITTGSIADGKTTGELEFQIKKNVIKSMGSAKPQTKKPKPASPKPKAQSAVARTPRFKNPNEVVVRRAKIASAPPVSKRVSPRAPPNYLPPEYVGMKRVKMPLLFTPTGQRHEKYGGPSRAPKPTLNNMFKPLITYGRNPHVLNVVYSRETERKIEQIRREREKRSMMMKPKIVPKTVVKKPTAKQNNNKNKKKKVTSEINHIMQRMKKLKAAINKTSAKQE